MKHILFVDDEPRVLEGLQNLLRKFRKEWDMVFACGGEEAVTWLGEKQFDVIVTDMRMPGIDGAQLLKHAQEHHPGAVRIVLSGQTEEEVARRIAFVAHQFLSKPCNPADLKEVVERACSLHALLGAGPVQSMVGRLGQLPAMPGVFAELVRVLENPDASLKDVAVVVQRDPSITAKVLQVVNSAFFGIPRPMGDVEQAVCYLGIDVIKSLALMIEVFHGLGAGAGPGGAHLDLEALQSHALASAGIARRLAPEGKPAQEAFIAAMLHDCGKLILATRMPAEAAAVAAEARATGRRTVEVEQERFGVTHAEVGAYLLGLWGFPLTIVEAVANHHEPGRVVPPHFGVLGAVHVANHLAHGRDWSDSSCATEAVHVANHLAHGRDRSDPSCGTEGEDRLDLAYLDSLGMTGQLDRWRALAAEELGATAKR